MQNQSHHLQASSTSLHFPITQSTHCFNFYTAFKLPGQGTNTSSLSYSKPHFPVTLFWLLSAPTGRWSCKGIKSWRQHFHHTEVHQKDSLKEKWNPITWDNAHLKTTYSDVHIKHSWCWNIVIYHKDVQISVYTSVHVYTCSKVFLYHWRDIFLKSSC